MKNFIARGDVLQFIATAAIVAGEVVVVEGLIGVAASNYAIGDDAVMNITGVYEVPKAASQAWAVGEPVYWDAANGVATTVSTAMLPMGFAANVVAGGAGDTLGHVRLTPTVPPAGA